MSDSMLPEDFKPLHEEKSKNAKDPFKVFIVFMMLICAAMIVVALLGGCASAPQPTLPLTMYIPLDNGAFQNSDDPTDVVSFEECPIHPDQDHPCRIKGMYLRPIDEISKTNEIMNQCVKWK